MMTTERRTRALTDGDVAALVDALEDRAVERLKENIGSGVLSLLGTWMLRLAILGAAYGLGASGVLKALLGGGR
jgi:hypothetical protein